MQYSQNRNNKRSLHRNVAPNIPHDKKRKANLGPLEDGRVCTCATSYSITEMHIHWTQVVDTRRLAWQLASVEEASCFCRQMLYLTWGWTSFATSEFLTYKQHHTEHLPECCIHPHITGSHMSIRSIGSCWPGALLRAHPHSCQQEPNSGNPLVVARWGLIPTTSGSWSCHEHITNLATGVSQLPVLDCGMTFHLGFGGWDSPSIPLDDLWKHIFLAT